MTDLIRCCQGESGWTRDACTGTTLSLRGNITKGFSEMIC